MNTKLLLLFMCMVAAMITSGSCQMQGNALTRRTSMPNIPNPVVRQQQRSTKTRPSRDFWPGPNAYPSRRQNMLYPNLPSGSNFPSDRQLLDIMRMNRYKDIDIPPSMMMFPNMYPRSPVQYPATQGTQSDMSFLFPLMALGGDAFEF